MILYRTARTLGRRTGTVSFLLLASLLATTSAAAQNLRLTLAAEPPNSGVISTRSAQDISLLVASGNRVSFARSSGRDYQLQAGGFYWTQVQELPRDADAVALTPTLQEDGSVEVQMDVSRKADTRQQSYSSTVMAMPGEWVQLLGPASTAGKNVKTYGTRSASAGESLYLLVEKP